MRKQLAAFVLVAAVSSGAFAQGSLPAISLECVAQSARLAQACPIQADNRTFMACKARNADLVTTNCQHQARARTQALATACRSNSAPMEYQGTCSAFR